MARPAAMLRNGRTDDQSLKDDEDLFRAYHPEAFDEQGRISLARLAFPDISMNRSEHGGLPEYARWAHEGGLFRTWGVWALAVRDVPERIVADPDEWDFRPCHTSQEQNYYHCDLRAYLHGVHQGEGSTVDDDVHYRFRVRIKRRIRRVLPPVPRDD